MTTCAKLCPVSDRASNPLPDFAHPPVVEVALAAQLAEPLSFDAEAWHFAAERGAPAAGTQSGWMVGIWERLRVLQELPADWNGYGELPIALEAVAQTAKLLGALGLPHPKPDIVPVSDGGIQIEWSGAGSELEVEVGPQGETHAYLVNAEGVEQEFDVAADGVSQLRAHIEMMR
ncbi:MAG: hypothetical protein OXG76_14330 [Acidimicrobiaceae bacterium]|nr:hypothetical protein [Acidimicrobiaceae bacterium]